MQQRRISGSGWKTKRSSGGRSKKNRSSGGGSKRNNLKKLEEESGSTVAEEPIVGAPSVSSVKSELAKFSRIEDTWETGRIIEHQTAATGAP
ncbi:hypothetical protein DY000_02049124 [Brassica cretica]|uniref:Uncharacterized protein n=1 Tax=Brassica cretica TaxID=69181 RepID=A0ABQ7F1P8_BRACR|nr:hypothetical protein DY000_02049124 [Brassica cretica]